MPAVGSAIIVISESIIAWVLTTVPILPQPLLVTWIPKYRRNIGDVRDSYRVRIPGHRLKASRKNRLRETPRQRRIKTAGPFVRRHLDNHIHRRKHSRQLAIDVRDAPDFPDIAHIQDYMYHIVAIGKIGLEKNPNGGSGIPADMLKQAIKNGISKVNIATDTKDLVYEILKRNRCRILMILICGKFFL